MVKSVDNSVGLGRSNVLAAVIEGATLTSRPPKRELERFTGCFFTLAYLSGTCVQTLPDPSTYLLIEIPEKKRPQCVLSGPRLKCARSSRTEPTQVLGIRLRPGVAFLITGVRSDRWVGRRKSLVDVLGPCVRELAVRIAEAESTDEKFDMLEAFLVERLAGKAVDQRVSTALHLIQTSAGAIRVRDIACRCGVSCRQLERLLRVWVGIVPKRLVRILGFRLRLFAPESNHTASGPTWLRSKTMSIRPI